MTQTIQQSVSRPSVENGRQQREVVILLHGMGRTWRSMWPLAVALKRAGYQVVNQGYPSTRRSIEWLSEHVVAKAVAPYREYQAIHFVTHSLGGILARHYLQGHDLPAGSRIVMLAPPNRGSEVADRLKGWKPYQWLNGPAGQQLGTDAASVPNTLQPVSAEIGVIAGSRSPNPLFSAWIEGADDGKVGVERARLAEMTDFLVVPVTHTFIMNHPRVIRQTLHFLQHGNFEH